MPLPGQYTRTKSHREQARINALGNKPSDETKEKQRQTALCLGIRPSRMYGEKNPMYGKRGSLSPHFKGYKFCSDCGKKLTRRVAKKCNRCNKRKPTTLLYKQIRNTLEYYQWRSNVFTRDEFTCQSCCVRGVKFNAHHIKSFLKILRQYKIVSLQEAIDCAELWNLNNGITLCLSCHNLAHKIRR